MNVKQLSHWIDELETHQKIVGGYQGSYVLGVTSNPLGFLLRVESKDVEQFPKSVTLHGTDVPVTVSGGFLRPETLQKGESTMGLEELKVEMAALTKSYLKRLSDERDALEKKLTDDLIADMAIACEKHNVEYNGGFEPGKYDHLSQEERMRHIVEEFVGGHLIEYSISNYDDWDGSPRVSKLEQYIVFDEIDDYED